MTIPQRTRTLYKMLANSEDECALSNAALQLASVDHFYPHLTYIDFGRFYSNNDFIRHLSRRVSEIRQARRIPVVESIRGEFDAYQYYKLTRNFLILTNCENQNYFAHNASSQIKVLKATLDRDKAIWVSRFKRYLVDVSEYLSESEISVVKDIFRSHVENVKHFFSQVSGKLRGLTKALSVTCEATDKRETIRKKTKFILTKTDDEDSH
jgi:hypothetical protein